MIRTLIVSAIIATALPAHAATFSANTAVASSEFSGSYLATNTINGSGLTSNTSVDEAHANYAANNHWTTTAAANPLDASITWGFTAPGGVTLGGLYIWNHRSNVIASNSGYEPTLFDLEIFDTSNASLAFFDDVSLSPNDAFAQRFNLPSILTGVGSITFSVEAVESSPNYTGLAEVAFEDTAITTGSVSSLTAVPLPATLPMIALGLGAVGLLRRRRRG